MGKQAVITHLHIKKTGFLSGIVLGTLGLFSVIADALINGVGEGLLAPASVFLLPKLGLWGMMVFPFLCFATGFLFGVLIAWLFNLAGRLTGGLDIEFMKES